MRRAPKAREGIHDSLCLRTRTPKAGEGAQHLVTASFEVVFEESDKSYHESDESQTVRHEGTGEHESNPNRACEHPDFATSAQAPGLGVKHGGNSKGVCGNAAKAQARGLHGKHGGWYTECVQKSMLHHQSTRARSLC